MQSPESKALVPNWLQQMNSISDYASLIVDRDDFTETDTGEREEWMILVDLKFKGDVANDQGFETPTDYVEDQSKYTLEQIGNMPHWIGMQKDAKISETNKLTKQVDILKLNYAQRGCI